MRLPPGWVVAVSLASAATLPGDALLYTVLPTLWRELGLDLWMVGVLLSANRFVRFATNPIAGWVFARAGARGPLLVAVVAAGLTTGAYGAGLGFAAFLAARIAWGVCWSFLRLGGYLAALGASEPGARGLAFGFYTGVASVGTLVAVSLGGLLTDQIGFTTTTTILAAIALTGGIGLLLQHPPQGGSPQVRSAAMGGAAGGHQAGGRGAVYAASFVNAAAGSGLVVSTLGLWLVELYGADIDLAGMVLGVATLNGVLLGFRFAVGIVWAPAAGHLSDRYGRRRTLFASGAAAVLSLLALSVPGPLAWTVASAIALFAAGTALRVALDTSVGDLAEGVQRARVLAWYTNWSDLGAAAGPFLAYPLAAAFGLEWVYRGGALCLLLAGLATVRVLPRGPTGSGRVEAPPGG